MARDPHYRAFPFASEFVNNFGMSLRDYFAGQALTGLIFLEKHKMPPKLKKDIAQHAYLFADAMLEAEGEK